VAYAWGSVNSVRFSAGRVPGILPVVLAAVAMHCGMLLAEEGADILVGYRESVTPGDVAAIEKRHRLVLVREFRSIQARLYRLPSGVEVAAALEALAREPGVKYAERDQPVRALPDPEAGG
jgi:hypothetical protein